MITYEMKNGMLPKTELDDTILHACYASAIPLSALWENTDDSPKIVSWDNDWEQYCEHRAALIDEDGRDSYLPWNIYKSLGLKWVDGYAYRQETGDCASFGHRNSFKASNLTNAKRTNRKPKDTAQSIVYAIARGNGSISFGSGCTLTPIAKYSSELGNFWSDDFGEYDCGGYVRKYQRNGAGSQHAKQTQSVIVFLPNTDFDTVYKVCAAGFGINMATSVFPATARVNSDDLAQVSGWDSGGHSMAFIAARKGKSGQPYLYLENSHGANYVADSLHSGKQFGCWLSESDFRNCGQAGDSYGTWYVNLGEMVK
jgi:hypothetical protein